MFDRLEIPTPFAVGDVNAYLAGRTLVDPGPDSEQAWSTLLSELEARDLAPGDLSRVLVTHPHPDHFGLASRLRAAGADVLASPAATPILRDFEGRLHDEQSFFVDFFVRHGMDRKTARTVTELPEAFLEYAPDVTVDRELADGDAVEFDVATPDGDEPTGGDTTRGDATVTARAVEGHAPGELLFAYEVDATANDDATGDDGESGPDDRERRALVGDHVLPEITPNPLLQPPPESGGERPRVLPAYNESLAALRDAGYDRFRPGHGEDVEDPGDRVEAILSAHAERTARVRELVDGPTTAADVMAGLFGDLPATEQFGGMSEAVGHLDVLEARGEVRPRERDGLVRYE